MITLDHPKNQVSIDLAHALLLMGVIASAKPNTVVELGYGDGYASKAILQALSFNGKGELLIVDNWTDWHGKQPEIGLPVNVLSMSEETFIKSRVDQSIDVLVSDADHHRSHEWLKDHLRVVKTGGYLFIHDCGCGTMFNNLKSIPERLDQWGIEYSLFQSSTRQDERCDRGWLMVHKTRETTQQG